MTPPDQWPSRRLVNAADEQPSTDPSLCAVCGEHANEHSAIAGHVFAARTSNPLFCVGCVEKAAEIERLTAQKQMDDYGYTVLRAERDRLRAALAEIVDIESRDMDGNPLPESVASFLASKALAGAADEPGAGG